MPVTEQVQEAVSNNRSAAITAAAAAATGAAATLAVRKVRSHNGSSGSPGEALRNVTSRGRSGASSILASAAESSWEAAADVLLPMAESAAESAGKYVAEHGPEVIRERIIPKFIEAFEDAK